MVCENCKVEFTNQRRMCHLCGANIGPHDKWFFDESAGGRPRHRHCENPQSYFPRADAGSIPRHRKRELSAHTQLLREHQAAMEALVGAK